MSREGETRDHVGRLEDTIKKNEKKISALEEQLKDHKENCVVIINDLRRKIKELQWENDDLRHQITELKKSNDFLDERVKQLEKNSEEKENKLEEFHEKIKKFEMSEDQLCIGQLLYDVEKNICKFVLEEFYDERGDHNPSFMHGRINRLIKDEGKRQKAKDRWEKLEKEIGWDAYERKEMKAITKKRNDVAHPTLTEESIRKAKESLIAQEQLSENMIEIVDTFTSMWKQTKSKLEAKKPEPESANEKQVRGRSGKRKQPQTAYPCQGQRLQGSQDGQSKNEEELRKKEQQLQGKEKEIEELKRKEKDAQQELQQQAQENKILTTRTEELKGEIESLNAEIKKLKEESEKQKEGWEKLKKENEEELRKKEQELQEKEKEIEELKRKEKDAKHKLQQQAQENKRLTTRIEELKEEIECLNAETKELKEELEKQKEESEKQKEELEKLKKELRKLEEENEEIKGNQHYLFLAAMCDQLLKNFYQIVFYPHNFSEYKQSYKVVNIERDIDYGFYGLTTEEDKRQARERWKDLKKKLGWESEDHVRGIKQLKYDRHLTAKPKITKDMKESLEERANALNHERKLDEPTFGIVQNLIKMWLETEDLVQEQEKKKNKEQRE